MAKEVIFVPGHDTQADDYPETLKALGRKDFTLDVLAPEWGDSYDILASSIGKALARKVGKKAIIPPVIIAHSMGANLVTRWLTEHEDLPRIGLVAASPSVACLEGYNYQKGREMLERDFPGPDNEESIKRFSVNSLKRIKNNVHAAVLVGENEAKKFPFMRDLALQTAQGLNVSVTEVPEAPHFIDYSPTYVQAIVDSTHSIYQELSKTL